MRRHSAAILMSLTKKELVEYVRMAEHNQDVAEEALKQQAENIKDWLPVVRCKDCKHVRIVFDGRLVCGATLNPNWVSECHFCSYGERG